MGFVDEAMDLIQRRHHVQVQDRKREDFAGPTQPAVNEKVNGECQDHDMEKPLVDRLAGTEERHLEVVTQLLGAPVLGYTLDPLGLLSMGVGRPDIVDPAELLDDRAVDSLSTVQQVESNAFLGDELPDSQAERHGDHSRHRQRDLGLLGQCRRQREGPHQKRRHEIQEPDSQESHHAVHTPRDSPVERSNLILRQHGEVDRQEVRYHPDRHVSVNPCTRVLD